MLKQQPPSPPPTIYHVLCETWRILSTHRRHFLILSLVFILPLSLCGTIYSEWYLFHPKTTLSILSIVYLILSSIMSLLVVGSVSFSSYNFLLDRPIKPTSSMHHSLFRSFPRLLLTSLASSLIIFIVTFALGTFAGVITMIEMFLFNNDQNSLLLYSVYTAVVMVTVGSIIVLYLAICWGLSTVVVVVESKYGFEPLRRSAQLMKGNKRILLSLVLFNVAMSLGFFYGLMYLIKQVNGGSKILLLVLSTAVTTAVRTSLMLVYFVAITVLYCKAAHGEYGSLPLVDDDDEKASMLDSHVIIPSSEVGMV